MTGQEELEHIQELKKRVEEQEYFIQELKSALDGLTGITYDADKVQTSVQGDPMLDKLVRLQDEEQKLKRFREEWIRWKVRMIRKIHRMDIGNLQKLLYVVYIEEHSLSECAGIMCWSYDHTKKQHRNAIREFEKLTPECPLNVP